MSARFLRGKGYAAGRKKLDATWIQRSEDRTRYFLGLLGYPKLALPRFAIVDRMTAKDDWLGMCTLLGADVRAFLSNGTPFTTTIQLQRAILADEYTFDRTLAHEICHHVEFLTYDHQELLGLQAGWKRVSHGERFKQLGERINKALGDPKFVNEKSDEHDKLSPREKPYWLFIMPSKPWEHPAVKDAPLLGWRWAVKLDERKRAWLREAVLTGLGILVETTERYWALGQAKIGGAVISTPRTPERQVMLRELVQLTSPASSLALLKPRLGELPPR